MGLITRKEAYLKQFGDKPVKTIWLTMGKLMSMPEHYTYSHRYKIGETKFGADMFMIHIRQYIDWKNQKMHKEPLKWNPRIVEKYYYRTKSNLYILKRYVY